MSANEHTDPTSSEPSPAHRSIAAPTAGSTLVTAVWQMLRALGVQHGRMLVAGAHPAALAGIVDPDAPQSGEFVAPIPPPGSPHTGLQLDHEPSPSKDGYDLVIHNLPLVSQRARSPHANKALADLQGHALRRAIGRTTPGGFTVALTSHHVLDAPDARHRHQILAMADLVGAVRLPSTLLPGPQGTPEHHHSPADADLTGAAVDLLVLRRRPGGEPDKSMPFIFISPVMVDDTPAAVNEYYDEMPEHVLGTLHHAPDHPGMTQVITPDPDIGRDLRDALSAVARRGTSRGQTTAPSPWPPDQGPASRTGQARRSPATPDPWTTPGAPPGHRPGPSSRPDPGSTTGLEW